MRIRIIKRTRATPVFNIGVVSHLTGLPVYTLRWIEQHQLVDPHRTKGNTRLFSEEEVEMLKEIRDLLEEDVNLPGIRIILRMRDEED